MSAPKKLFIKTYGCQMNVYDSERMAEQLGGEGYVRTESADDADMIKGRGCDTRDPVDFGRRALGKENMP